VVISRATVIYKYIIDNCNVKVIVAPLVRAK
jgi:hypothetical protein